MAPFRRFTPSPWILTVVTVLGLLGAISSPPPPAIASDKPRVFASIRPDAKFPTRPDRPDRVFGIQDPSESELARLVNRVRSYYGLKPLTYSKTLSRAAEGHCLDMARHHFVSHTGTGGTTPWHRIRRAGYPARRYGENVAAGIPGPKQVVEAWLQSPSHRKVLLNPKYREMGIGYVASPQSPHKHYWVLELASR
ncbi:Uncharacterized conserved protein YkwD, contains CAP (CSP/antigen 5/PR1) domain [Desulfacinum hydrothermale DSM 13146]|uniref:Uncharacterized conserved protein YkwD, contains CAP (CSP/antigen 5/PR1) domain n=1 Tax=Desulfacinum hydrothermale DSM 13146 TaxID=1121390 RepID=A0A1W1XS12_9BACT|nr:CAP domain-containing protein [Desulfacinum hydrothermale]SMC26743.1 Uncharacterized conserved protein YkwD, contains CAP (CSP/antigen 5/PR1) domain [Desulfacinum hydrothermale DSM 13146]